MREKRCPVRNKKIRNLLEDHEERIKLLESMFKSLKSEEVTSLEGKIGIEKLAKKIDVTSDKIVELFDIEDNALTLLKVVGEDEIEKIHNISLVVLLGYKYFFDDDEVLSKEIRRNVAENGIPLNNFATYLKVLIPSLIRRKGKLKSPKTTYKLTPLGKTKAKEILKKLCE